MTDGIGTAGAASGAGAGQGGGAQDGGGQQAPWYSAIQGLSDDARNWVVGKGFQDPASALASAASAEKLLRERNVIPAPNLDKLDDWEGWTTLGWTPKRDDYKIAPKELPKGVEYSKAMEAKFLDLAHSQRIPAKRAEALLNGMLDMMVGELDAVGARGLKTLDETRTALQGEWGDKYESNLVRAQAAARAFGIELQDVAQLNKIMGDAKLVKAFARLGSLLDEDTLKGGAASGQSRGQGGLDAARAEQERLRNDPAFAARLRKGDRAAIEQWQALSDRIAKG
jgi:hypothetical protein